MGLADYDYELADAAIAQRPAEPRDSARLLVAGDPPEHRTVRDLPELLRVGDLLVVNETRVLPARLRTHKETGGAVEVLLLEPSPADPACWEALVRPGRRVSEGMVLLIDGRPALVVGPDAGDDGRRLVRLEADIDLDDVGEVPLPPYIHEQLSDPERYQTVYARTPGSVAAPTAGLHLTHEVLRRCRDRGVSIATVDLVVGLGTFKPIAVDDLTDHRMHEERYDVPERTMAACVAAERVVAVGTTTVRALESAARGALTGRTELFITPGFDFQVVDVLMTNFHVPRSSLLVLLAAFCGPRWRDLYRTALDSGYRFLSFGDAMLVERDPQR
ncbi:MAG TPA: tRNA preQ1(34) S-adenosylmethionine ribosyltransferase-isomerase QueA [Acidimicrobiales bacterium]|nr:tRNA preQ1(34) S-adenosylmethionine ribosyltransferase-isomerase QueA [Acidimicrobiales bacterium]